MKGNVIRIQRKTLRNVGILVTLILGIMMLVLGFYLLQQKNYIRDVNVSLRRNDLIGQQLRVRGYLQVEGTGQSVQACDSPQDAFTSFGLSRIHLMDCTVDQCTITCPLFMPHIHEGYEILGTLEYCPGSDERLCLVDVTEVYLLAGAAEALDWVEQKVPIRLGPSSYSIGQEWERWKP